MTSKFVSRKASLYIKDPDTECVIIFVSVDYGFIFDLRTCSYGSLTISSIILPLIRMRETTRSMMVLIPISLRREVAKTSYLKDAIRNFKLFTCHLTEIIPPKSMYLPR